MTSKLYTNLFFVDEKTNCQIKFDELVREYNEYRGFTQYLRRPTLKQYFLNLLDGIINDRKITILDLDFSDEEIDRLIDCTPELPIVQEKKQCSSINEMIEQVKNSKAQLELFTSGTTGKPKKILHSVNHFLNTVKLQKKDQKNIWGYAFNPTHMAGLQVFFQALCNKSTLINIFGYSRQNIYQIIDQYKITHISASPSFYRMLMPVTKSFNKVKRITLGGESSTKDLLSHLVKLFPEAKITNIYASTEAGTVLVSKGNSFVIPKSKEGLIKIVDNELFFHKSLVGAFHLNEDWYATGDLVQIIQTEPITFRFSGRKGNIINVGGYNVNPDEITDVLLEYPLVQDAKIFGKKNSLIGTLLIAEVQLLDNAECTEKELIDFLKTKLQSYKVPRIIRLVEAIQKTRTGKKSI